MDDQIRLRFGNAVRKLRMQKNISQEDFAYLCGLHRTYISDIELGKRNISLDNIEKIAEAFNISLADLFKEI
ncbi:MAG: helix-turn-helix transcriptional regulator [Lachnospiraceae bacterium]|nr:helix-turn-helix transcriptional regulator [Lachnospiraceae bacterium]MBR3736535.1 helix-turn-helix transcriptional regulator [Lachnospiraceae bacterium]